MTQAARIAIAAAAVFTLSHSALAQSDARAAARVQQDVDKFQRQLDEFRANSRVRVNDAISPGTRAYYDYGLFTSVNYLSLDDANLDNRGLRQFDTVGFARINLDGVHEGFFRGRVFYRDFNPGDEFKEGSDHEWDGHLDRLYYKFDLGRYLSARSGEQGKGGATIKLGRDLVYWGTGLTLAQDLDAVVVDLTYDPFAIQFVAGRTPSDTVDFDSSRRDFDGHTNRWFYGMLAQGRVNTHRPYGFVLVQRDHNPNGSTVEISGTTINTEYDYNSYYIGIGSTGALGDRLAYGVELVYEGGTTLSNSFDDAGQIDQTKDDISAFAANVQLDYLVGDRRNTRISGEVIFASGDDDRLSSTNTFAGNTTGTTDNGFNAFGLLNTGVALSPSVSNLISLRAGVSTFPAPEVKALRKLQLGGDVFVFFKADDEGGFDEPTNDESYLGFEPNIYVNWQITTHVSLAMRYGIFFPGDAIQADDKNRQFFFAGLTFAF